MCPWLEEELVPLCREHGPCPVNPCFSDGVRGIRSSPGLEVSVKVLLCERDRERAVAAFRLACPYSDGVALVMVPHLAGGSDELASAEVYGLTIQYGVLFGCPSCILGRSFRRRFLASCLLSQHESFIHFLDQLVEDERVLLIGVGGR